nr:hypothetical protein [Devosia sp. WQ 349K1]
MLNVRRLVWRRRVYARLSRDDVNAFRLKLLADAMEIDSGLGLTIKQCHQQAIARASKTDCYFELGTTIQRIAAVLVAELLLSSVTPEDIRLAARRKTISVTLGRCFSTF